MKSCTDVHLGLLSSNLPGAGANFLRGRHIGWWFKMAATKTAFQGYRWEKVCADVFTSMKMCSEIHWGLLSANLPGAKANFQQGCLIGLFKMAATRKQLNFVTGLKKCIKIYAQAWKFAQRYIRSAELKSAGHQSQFSTGPPYWMIQNGRYKKQLLGVTGQKKCVLTYAQAWKCAQRCKVHLGLLNSNLLRAKANFFMGRPYRMIQNGCYKNTFQSYWPEKVCKYWCISLKICTGVHLGLLSSNLPRANANS